MTSYTITLHGAQVSLQWTFTEEMLGQALVKVGRIIEERGIEPSEPTDRLRLEVQSYPA